MELIRAHEDFDAARFRAFRRAVTGVLTRRGRQLVAMDGVLGQAGRGAQAARGTHAIPLSDIAGSASAGDRPVDFDATFLPRNRRPRDRWTRIYTAMTEGEELPAIDVYKVGSLYYVQDGHHRVSVARSLGRDTIPARIVEVPDPASQIDVPDMLLEAERSAFYQVTGLGHQRPQAELRVTRLGRYDELLRHVLGHRYFLGLERGEEVSMETAATSWYDHVYRPVVGAIRRHHVLERLVGWTEPDAYVEITRRWLRRDESGDSSQPGGPEEAVRELLSEQARRGWRGWRDRLASALRRVERDATTGD